MENGGQTKATTQDMWHAQRRKKWTTHWLVKEVRGEHGSTTEVETALRDNCAGWEPQLDLERAAVVEAVQRPERNGEDHSGENRCCCHNSRFERAAMAGRHGQEANSSDEHGGVGKNVGTCRHARRTQENEDVRGTRMR